MNVYGFFDVPWWILLIVFAIALFIVYMTSTHGIFKAAGIPGPPPGIFGIMPQYGKLGVGATDIELIKKYGRLVGIFHGHAPMLLIADTAIIKDVCVKQFNKFVNRKDNIPQDDLMSLNVSVKRDNEWRYVRGILSPTFSGGKLKHMVPLINKCTHTLIGNLKKKAESGEDFEVRSFMNGFTIDVICSVVFGIELDSQQNPTDPFVTNAVSAVNFSILSPKMMLCVIFPFMVSVLTKLNIGFMDSKNQAFFADTIRRVIEEKNSDPQKREDVLQLMINARNESVVEGKTSTAEDKHEFTEKAVIANSMVFLFAGFETVAASITFTSYCLATNPDLQTKVINEIDYFIGNDEVTYDNIFKLQYLDRVINEALRLYPPALRLSREVSEDIEFKGHKIPAGIELAIAVYALHHDPEFWQDPEKFDPDRFHPDRKAHDPYCYLPFGIGPRNCIGMRLALLEVKLAIVAVLRHFRFVTSPTTQIPIELAKDGLFLRAAKGVWLKVEAR